MWKKFAFIRLVNAHHKWNLLNKRYRALIKKYRNLPKDQFLVKAYKKYTQSAEYAVRKNTKAYKLTAKRSGKYLRNLRRWVKKQQNKIRVIRYRMARYLRKNGRRLGSRARKIRAQFRRRLAKESTRVRRIMQYWKARIGSGRIPTITTTKTRAQLLAQPRALTPHPMVPFLKGAKKAARRVRRRAHRPSKWFEPIRNRRQYSRQHVFKKRGNKGKKLSPAFRKWQQKLRASFKNAWRK